MSAVVASRTRGAASSAKKTRAGTRDAALPPAKKTKLTGSAPNGYSALLSGTPNRKAQGQAKPAARTARNKVADATAVVGNALDADVDMTDAHEAAIEISSAEEGSEYSSDEDEADQDPHSGARSEEAPAVNGNAAGEEEAAGDDEEPTFGDKLQAQEPESARAPRVVDVVDEDTEVQALTTASNTRALAAPSATSLGTVLTQALRTNDKDLLDSCLRVSDVDTIYATVERLPSPLVGNLLQKLAERLYTKPGRAGILMVWVQWSLAAHGGYLASQPQLVKQLATLNKVLKERASGLQPLLSLKGRLDMLQAQLELRRRNQRKAVNDDEDEAVIYVEGEDDISSDEEDSDADSDAGLQKRLRQGSEDESDDMMPTTMEMDEDDEGSEDSDDLLDDEAEETDNDTGDDISEPMSDDDLDGGDDVSEGEEPQSVRRSTAGRSGIARRY